MKQLIYKAKIAVAEFFRKKVIIPSYEEKRDMIDFYRNQFNTSVLVETGTFLGDTVEYFKSKFSKVYSIELSKELAAKAAKRFEGQDNVQIIEGDSGDVLASLAPGFTSPALFWLDGHYSSEFFHNGEYIKTARSDKDTPIEKELTVLLNSPVQHVIMIDDARLFTGRHDYPTIKNIGKKVAASANAYQCFVKKDIIIIIPTK